MESPRHRRVLSTLVEGPTTGAAPANPCQPGLFDLFPQPPGASAAATTWMVSDAGRCMRSELTVFASCRGWRAETTHAVLEALALFAAVGGLEADPLVVPADLAAELRRRYLPATRLAEFLAHLTDRPVRIEHNQPQAIADRVPCDLPAAMRREVALWLDALSGATGRSRPLAASTIAGYLRAVLPPIRSWASQYTSLREVTSDDAAVCVQPLSGSARVGTTVALRSLFKALKSQRVIFTDPARSVHPGRFPRRPVLEIDPITRGGLLADTDRVDHQLVMLLAGVHALTRADIAGVLIDDVDPARRRLRARARRVSLDALTDQHLQRWLEERRRRWPSTANPHLLITGKSAYGVGPVSTQYFRGLPTVVSRLRADRLLAAAEDTGGDPLAIKQMFGVDDDTAVRYCNELLAVEPSAATNEAHNTGEDVANYR